MHRLGVNSIRGDAIRRICAAALLAGCGCGGAPVVVPGFVAPGANRPPVISQADLTVTSSGQLKLVATAFDPDGDAIVVGYEQRSGPFVTPSFALSVAGSASYLFNPNGDAQYGFRIIASDGFFDAAADVAVNVGDGGDGDQPPAGTPPPVSGLFTARIFGATTANGASASFALDGALELATPDPSVQIAPRLSVLTTATPAYAAAPNGALLFDVEMLHPEVAAEGIVVIDGELWSARISDPPNAPSQYRVRSSTGASGKYPVQSFRIEISTSPTGFNGALWLSSRVIPIESLPDRAEYSAQFTAAPH